MTKEQIGVSIFNRGGRETHLVCDDLGNERDYTLAVVDPDGAVTQDEEGRFHRLNLALRPDSIRVHLGVNDNPTVELHGQLSVTVGDHSATIRGTPTGEIVFNGAFPGLLNERRGRIRYPITR